MNRYRRMFHILEDDPQLAASDGFRDVIGIKPGQAAPSDRGREGRANGVLLDQIDGTVQQQEPRGDHWMGIQKLVQV
jgi:hypothetical protein